MKNLNSLKSAAAALALAFLGACSGPVYTFAPGTGAYHGTEATAKVKTEAPAEAAPVAYAAAETTSPETAAPAANAQTEASAALAQAFTAQKNAPAEAVTHATKADKKAAAKNAKELRQKLKEYKKDIKDGTDAKASVNKTAIVLIIIGLILALLGGSSILGVLGVIFIVVGLVLILLDLL